MRKKAVTKACFTGSPDYRFSYSKYARITSQEVSYPIQKTCRTLSVSPNTQAEAYRSAFKIK